MNYFTEILNFIFPKQVLKEKRLISILKSRNIYFSKNNRIVFFPYKNNFVKESIWTMKFHNNFLVAEFFAKVIYENLPEILEDLAVDKNFIEPVLINIPITFSKKISRKYNQNDIVIKHFLKLGGNNFVDWKKNILIKTKNTKPQSRIKNREKRFENIKNSFGIKNSEQIKNRNILLFDDVLTSGATLNEAKKVLKKAGAKKVFFMVLAH